MAAASARTIAPADVAAALGITKRAVNKRAAVEHWPGKSVNRRGDRVLFYDGLPESVRIAICAHQVRQLPAKPNETRSKPNQQCPLFPDPADRPAVTAGQMDRAMAKADLLRLYTDAVERADRGHKCKSRKSFMRAYNSGLAFPEIFGAIGKASWQTIEGWKRCVRQSGDTLALVDRRGEAARGVRALTCEQQEIVIRCALHPNRPLKSEAIRMAWDVMHARGIPNGRSSSTYRRFLDDWISENFHIWTFSREGAKAWNDKCAFSIERDYSLINVGDILIADGHVLNFEILNPWTGRPCRMTLLLWYDMKSNYPAGWEIMPTENTACIAAALRRAILRLGQVPKVAYLDNGKAFSGRFFNGADLAQAGFSGMFERLGMRTIFAWPYHAQSKTVERFFGTFAELERWAPTYTGTSIENKPPRLMRGERLHRAVYEKATGGRSLTMEQAHRAIAGWFDAYAARPQRGHLEGRFPAEVFADGKGPGVDAAELRYLMLSMEARTIGRNGIRIFGRNYWHPELYGRRHPVTVRYDLQDMSSVIVEYQGRLLCEATVPEKVHPAASILGNAADVKRLSEQIAVKRRQEKEAGATARAFLEAEVLPEHRRMLEGEGLSDAGAGRPTAQAQADRRVLTAADQRRIEAEAVKMTADDTPAVSTVFDQAAPMADLEGPAFWRTIETLPESERYDRLILAEASGWMVPARWQAYMSYFEQTPAYTARVDWWEERRARMAACRQGEEAEG